MHDADMVGFADERGSAGSGSVQFQGIIYLGACQLAVVHRSGCGLYLYLDL